MADTSTYRVRSVNRIREPRTEHGASRNRLIACLSQADQLLVPALEPVRLRPDTVVYHQNDPVRYAYFPVRGLISLYGMTADGEMLQVGAIGSSGLVGVQVVLEEVASPHHVAVHVPSDAYRASGSALRELCRRSPTARQALLREAHSQLVLIGHAALCHRFHTARQRLSRWLLIYASRTSSDTVDLTQDVLAQILGSPRTVVSRAANQLQDVRAVRQLHGRLQILDRGALAKCACPCDI